MESDIVTRLRGHIAITTRLHYAKDGYPEPVYVHGPSPICQEAADEIERLRVIVQGWEHSARNAERDMATLRAERDEARREVCYLKAWNFDRAIKPEDYARLRKWACYEQAVRRSEQNEAEVPGLRRALEAELRKAMYESEG
jgi:hypothetical protein